MSHVLLYVRPEQLLLYPSRKNEKMKEKRDSLKRKKKRERNRFRFRC